MPIATNSRYTTAILQTVKTPRGPQREMRIPFPRARRFAYTYHRIVSGERIDILARRYYGDATLWWMIANANPEIMDWFPEVRDEENEKMPLVSGLPAGTVLRIPNA